MKFFSFKRKQSKHEGEKCEVCEDHISISEKYDAKYCLGCDVWKESVCNDSSCDYCDSRPIKPSKIGRDADVYETQTNHCPVCGYDLGFPAWSYGSSSDEMCPSCGIHFGLDDAKDGEFRLGVYNGWRTKWSVGGYQWSSVGIHPPKNWDPKEQVKKHVISHKNEAQNYDTIKFVKVNLDHYPDEYFVVDIYVNGENIINTFNHNQGPEKPDEYSGLSVYDFIECIKDGFVDGKDEEVDVLCCGCGELGCGSLRAKIKEDEDSVMWSNFSSPPRSKEKPFFYKFEKSQYLEAISKID